MVQDIPLILIRKNIFRFALLMIIIEKNQIINIFLKKILYIFAK